VEDFKGSDGLTVCACTIHAKHNKIVDNSFLFMLSSLGFYGIRYLVSKVVASQCKDGTFFNKILLHL